jgi:hypothetical protein
VNQEHFHTLRRLAVQQKSRTLFRHSSPARVDDLHKFEFLSIGTLLEEPVDLPIRTFVVGGHAHGLFGVGHRVHVGAAVGAGALVVALAGAST